MRQTSFYHFLWFFLWLDVETRRTDFFGWWLTVLCCLVDQVETRSPLRAVGTSGSSERAYGMKGEI